MADLFRMNGQAGSLMTDTKASTGLLLIISGPSGVGKTTITRRVEAALDGVFSVSVTTRPKAAGDREGVDYYFLSDEEFQAKRQGGDLLEWAQVFDHCYGTPRQAVERNLADGRLVLLEIDVQGAVQVKQNMPEAYAVFVLPPSEAALLERLRGRQRDDEATIQRRFAKAKLEITKAHESGVYDRFVVNDDLEAAVRETIEAVEDERQRRGEK